MTKAPQGYVRVGIATPGSPCGDIWVSPAMIAQVGYPKILEMVRQTFRAAYDAEYRSKGGDR